MPKNKPVTESPEKNNSEENNQLQVIQNIQTAPAWWQTPISAAIGGAIGGYLCFAFEGLKKRAQSNQLISKASFHPKELLRGSTSFAMSVGSTSVAQFTIQRLLRNLPLYDDKSVTWNVGTAMASGMCGAFFSTMVENIILQQQLAKSGPSKAIRELFKQGYARPWLGLPELMVREGGFALTMLYLAFAVGEHIKSKTNNNALVYAGEIAVGVFGAALTHPFDTAATYKQKNLTTSKSAFMNIYAKDGIAGFYKGVGWRALLFTGCMLVIPYTEKKAGSALQEVSLFSTKPVKRQEAMDEKELKKIVEEQQSQLRGIIRSHS